MIVRSKRAKPKRYNQRSGGILVIALVSLSVATVIMLSILGSSSRSRIQLRNELRIEQARWLLDGGLSHALASVEKQADYKGETITVDPQLDGKSKATVKISVDRAEGSKEISIYVTAKITAGNQVSQRSKQVKLNELPTKEN